LIGQHPLVNRWYSLSIQLPKCCRLHRAFRPLAAGPFGELDSSKETPNAQDRSDSVFGDWGVSIAQHRRSIDCLISGSVVVRLVHSIYRFRVKLVLR